MLCYRRVERDDSGMIAAIQATCELTRVTALDC